MRRSLEGLDAGLRDPGADGDAQREVGSLLTACVGLARALGVDPEGALRGANAELEARARRAAEEHAERKAGSPR